MIARRVVAGAMAALLPATAALAEGWVVGCKPGGCSVGQGVMAEDRLMARVLITELRGTEIVEVLFPLGVSLLTPVFLHIDDDQQFEVRVAACKENGCYGVIPDGASAVAAFKAGSEMKLRFTGFDDGKTYFFPFTLAGFTAAYGRYRNGTP